MVEEDGGSRGLRMVPELKEGDCSYGGGVSRGEGGD